MQIFNRNFSVQSKVLLGAFCILVILTIRLQTQGDAAQKSPTAQPVPAQADTFIPKGAVLVPIELQNIQAVAGLIGDHGIIDLYGILPNGHGFQIAEALKILQAPLNPEQYAVLTTTALAKKIMQYRGSYWGVVRNRSVIYSPPKSAAAHHRHSRLREAKPIPPEKVRPAFRGQIRRQPETAPIEIEYHGDEMI